MRLLETDMVNFMPYKTATIPMDKQGLVLIEGEHVDRGGSNRSGKSSIFEGVVWGLFGQTLRGLTGNEVVIDRGKGKGTSVANTFLVDDKLYRVIRYRKHPKFKNSLLLKVQTKNGKWKDKTEKSIKDTQAKIDKLIGYTYVSFINSTMFGQGITKFFTSATDKEKKDILEKLLGLDRYGLAFQIAKKKKAEFDSTIVTKQTKLESLVSKLEETKPRLKEYRKLESSFEGDVHKTVSKLREKVKAVNKPTGIKRAEKALLRAQKEVREQASTVKNSDKLEKRMLSVIEDVNSAGSGLAILEESLKRVSTSKKKKGNLVDTNCPMCEKLFTDKDNKKLLKHINKNARKIKDDIQVAKKKYDELVSKKKTIASKIKKLRRAEHDLQEASVEVAEIQFKVSGLEKDRKLYDKTVGDLKSRIKEAENQKNPYNKLVTKEKKKAKTLRTKRDTLQSKLASMYTEAEYYDFWEKGFGRQGLPSFILDSVMPILNRKANKYLNEITDGQINVDISTQTTLKSGKVKDKFDVSIINRDGSNLYKGSSGGEKRVIDIAILLALHSLVRERSQNPVNIVFLDEIFDTLSSPWTESVMEAVRKEQESSETSTFVISHNETIQAFFDKRLMVIKENDYSRVEIPNV